MGSFKMRSGCVGVAFDREAIPSPLRRFTPSVLRWRSSWAGRNEGVADVGGVGSTLLVPRGVVGAVFLCAGVKRRELILVMVRWMGLEVEAISTSRSADDYISRSAKNEIALANHQDIAPCLIVFPPGVRLTACDI